MLNEGSDRWRAVVQPPCGSNGACVLVKALDVDALSSNGHGDITVFALATQVDTLLLRLDHTHALEVTR